MLIVIGVIILVGCATFCAIQGKLQLEYLERKEKIITKSKESKT